MTNQLPDKALPELYPVEEYHRFKHTHSICGTEIEARQRESWENPYAWCPKCHKHIFMWFDYTEHRVVDWHETKE